MNKTVLKILLKNHFPAAAVSPCISGFGQQREDFVGWKKIQIICDDNSSCPICCLFL
jgi:hypothetical protein